MKQRKQCRLSIGSLAWHCALLILRWRCLRRHCQLTATSIILNYISYKFIFIFILIIRLDLLESTGIFVTVPPMSPRMIVTNNDNYHRTHGYGLTKFVLSTCINHGDEVPKCAFMRRKPTEDGGTRFHFEGLSKH